MSDDMLKNPIGLEVMVNQSPWTADVEVLLYQRAFKEIHVVTGMIAEVFAEGAPVKAPSFSMNPMAAQELFNKLWILGYRPKDGTGNSGHIEALKYHLEDMRKLVFEAPKNG